MNTTAPTLPTAGDEKTKQPESYRRKPVEFRLSPIIAVMIIVTAVVVMVTITVVASTPVAFESGLFRVVTSWQIRPGAGP